MVLGCAILSVNDAIMKSVTAALPLGESIFLRGMFTFGPVGWLVYIAGGWQVLRINRWTPQLARGALLALSTLCFLESLSHMPMAEATALVFASPIILTMLAPKFLGERVNPRAWFAVSVGFAGVLLMVQPDSTGFRWVVVLPLIAALCEAVRDVITRRLMHSETSESMLLVSMVSVSLVALATSGFGWRVPTNNEWMLLALAGLLLGAAQFLMTDAFRYAAAVVVAPFRYSGVVWALLAGFVAFGELPGGMALVGAGLVVASGLYVLADSLRRDPLK
jgi:drug/metabolite transporter (DMT)-like permease